MSLAESSRQSQQSGSRGKKTRSVRKPEEEKKRLRGVLFGELDDAAERGMGEGPRGQAWYAHTLVWWIWSASDTV